MASYFGLLRDHFGQCALEELLSATQGSLWPVCCGRATLGYSGTTLGSVLWKSYFGLLRDHSGECAVEELLWATQGPLWPVCCGRAGHFGQCAVEELLLGWITFASVLWKGYFGLLRDHFGQCAVEELSWATGRTEVQSSKNLTTPQSYGWGKTNTNNFEVVTARQLLLLFLISVRLLCLMHVSSLHLGLLLR